MKSSKTSFLRNCISGWNVRGRTICASVVSKVTASVVSKFSAPVVLTGTDAQIVRPYNGLHVGVRPAVTRQNRYTSCCSTTDALRLDTSRASLQRVTRQSRYTSKSLHVGGASSGLYVRLTCWVFKLLLLLRCISSTHLICTPLVTMIVNLPVRPFTITKLVSTS